MAMEYNVCEICGAKDGRAGFLLANPKEGLVAACQNCNDTRSTGIITIHSHLSRTPEEIKKTMDILSKKINETLVLYAVRNAKGEYFRAKGYGGGGASWVDDINKAKIYGKTGGARGTITWFANNHPSYPTPDLIKLTVSSIEVMYEKARVKKAIEKKEKSEAAAKEREAQRKLADAERNYLIAKDNLKKLKR